MSGESTCQYGDATLEPQSASRDEGMLEFDVSLRLKAVLQEVQSGGAARRSAPQDCKGLQVPVRGLHAMSRIAFASLL
ncbi:hypothetical protein E2C01_030351 [Portunus trituberculatus]|uniref:Uncharacterized protein n=1 Tax=Portunus trituberculatus TaxID=210409 RepID=A0A5B7ERU2_PORTR|nr:hypothetical protein [Portunus trituberculatus]